MKRSGRFHFAIIFILTLFQVSLAVVAPQKLLLKLRQRPPHGNITKYAQSFKSIQTKLSHTLKTEKTPNKLLFRTLSTFRSTSDHHVAKARLKIKRKKLVGNYRSIQATTAQLRSSSRKSGLTFDPCSDASDCAGARLCLEDQGDSLTDCSTGDDCFCRVEDPDDIDCTSDTDCDDGESCSSLGLDEDPFCISDDIIADLDPAVCIGSESLTHFARDELVFERDTFARVLCDMNKSCATPGHMVIYNGKALMMKSYCKAVGCLRRVMQVNSPKYIQRLIIPSKTQGLMFTAFAARFETLAEQRILSVAIRVGL